MEGSAKKNRLTVFTRFLKNMLLILAIPSVFLIVFYFNINGRLKEQAYEQSRNVLQYSAREMEQVFEQLDNVIVYFYNNSNIIDFYYYTDPVKDGSTTSSLHPAREDVKAMGISNSSLLNIQLYAAESGILADYRTTSLYTDRYYGSNFRLTGVSYETWKRDYLSCSGNVRYSRANMTFQGLSREVLVYNREFVAPDYEKVNNRILFYLDKGKLMNCFETIAYGNGGFVCLTDQDGTVLMEENTGSVDLGKWRLQDAKEDCGYYIEQVDGEELFITYVKDEKRGWNYIAAVPLIAVTGVAEEIGRYMSYIFIAAAAVGILLVILTAYRLSRPMTEAWEVLNTRERDVPFDDFIQEIRKLVSDNEELNREMQRQLPVIRTSTFYSFLIGEWETPQEKREALARIEVRQDAAYYVMLIVMCNDINWDADLEDITAQKVFIETAFKQQGSSYVQGFYQMDFDRMVILLTMDDPSVRAVRDRSEMMVSNMLEAVRKNIHFSISVGGDIVDDVMRLSESFYHANAALEIPQDIFGENPVQWYEMIPSERREKTESPQGAAGLACEVKGYLDSHYMDAQLSLTVAAEEFHVTETYLSKLFKRETGQNFSKYLEQVRVTRAKKLIDGGMPVGRAAEEVGYNSVQVFRRAWKRYYGTTPSERKSYE